MLEETQLIRFQYQLRKALTLETMLQVVLFQAPNHTMETIAKMEMETSKLNNLKILITKEFKADNNNNESV